MGYLASFSLSIFIIFNCIFFGCVLKRFFFQRNMYFLFFTSFLFVAGIFYVFSIILFVFSASIIFYIFIFLSLQIILLLLYLYNWRYILENKWIFNKKSTYFLLFFIISLFVCFIYTYTCYPRSLYSTSGYYSTYCIIPFISYVKNQNYSWYAPIDFTTEIWTNDFNILYVLDVIIINLFKLKTESFDTFIKLGWIFPFSFLISSLTTSIFFNFINSKKNLLSYLVLFICFDYFLTLFSFMYGETTYVDSTWLLMFITYFLILCFFYRPINNYEKTLFLTMNIFTIYFVNQYSTYVCICLAMFLFLYSVYRNLNVFFILINVLLIIFFTTSISVSLLTNSPFVFIIIALVFSIALFSFRSIRKKNFFFINKKSYTFFRNNIWFFVVLFYIFVYLYLFYILAKNNFSLFYKFYNFDYLFNIDVTKANNNIIVQTLNYLFYLVILFIAIASWWKKTKYNVKDKLYEYLVFFIFFAFLNPFTPMFEMFEIQTSQNHISYFNYILIGMCLMKIIDNNYINVRFDKIISPCLIKK